MNTIETPFSPNTPTNLNCWAGYILAETFVKLGGEYAVFAPGSRSGPLTISFASHPKLQSFSILDERSAAFFALGLAKQSHKPVVLIVTSGTAAANLYPAIIEARLSGVPLIVLTADRPKELQHCHEEQTICQTKLYGSSVLFFSELPLIEQNVAICSAWRQTFVHCWHQSAGAQMGPVHLNVPFRKPLEPSIDPVFTEWANAIDWEKFFSHLEAPCKIHLTPLNQSALGTQFEKLEQYKRGLILIGAINPPSCPQFAQHVATLSNLLGFPVLAEGLSGLRGFASNFKGTLITHYDALLRDKKNLQAFAPEVVIFIGRLPTSKVLRSALQEWDAPTISLTEGNTDNFDCLHLRTAHWPFSLESLLDTTTALFQRAPQNAPYIEMWSKAQRRAQSYFEHAFSTQTELFEGKIPWQLSEILPAETPVFIANSMPIRDCEYFWQPNSRENPIYVNRGANGIDGTLSSALGVAQAAQKPSILLTGDLALLHDTNGFLCASQFTGSLTIVLVNNNGGRIFENLPIQEHPSLLERCFVTPQKMDFALLAQAYGASYTLVQSWGIFSQMLTHLPQKGIRVLEIRTESTKDIPIRRELLAMRRSAS